MMGVYTKRTRVAMGSALPLCDPVLDAGSQILFWHVSNPHMFWVVAEPVAPRHNVRITGHIKPALTRDMSVSVERDISNRAASTDEPEIIRKMRFHNIQRAIALLP